MTQAARDGAAVRFPPPLIPLATILAGVGLQRLWPLPAGFLPGAPLRQWIGWGIIAAAVLVLGLWPVVLFRRSGQSELPWRPTPSIIEAGPFRMTRNPMYLQMVLICIGFGVVFANPWILLLTPACAWALYHWAIRHEEAYLERKFGQAYLDYKHRVRRWI